MREAEKQELLRKMELTQAARFGMAEDKSYVEEMTKLHFQWLNLEHPEGEN